ncbi:hypothetical protein EYR27_19455 [Xanthomonas oryzae]|nr:hypothetical protein EYR27_19455 [Xanthomonas oryzae]
MESRAQDRIAAHVSLEKPGWLGATQGSVSDRIVSLIRSQRVECAAPSPDSGLAVLGKNETAPGSVLSALLKIREPTISTGPCPPAVAGPVAAWMLPRS